MGDNYRGAYSLVNQGLPKLADVMEDNLHRFCCAIWFA